MASGLIGQLLDHPGFYGIAAELDGRVVGSNFLDERSHIIGLGPITVDPAVQNRTVGRRLMECMLTRVRDDDVTALIGEGGMGNRNRCGDSPVGDA